jgi:hypothetical protein
MVIHDTAGNKSIILSSFFINSRRYDNDIDPKAVLTRNQKEELVLNLTPIKTVL